MSDDKPTLDISDLGSALPFHAPVLSDEDRASLVNAIEDKIQRFAGPSLDVTGILTPEVRKRVEVLQEIQIQHDVLQAKFFEERAALEAKYLELYEPLYNKRFEIVNGVVDVEGNTSVTAEETTSDEKATEVKGIPSFWLTAMKTNEVLAEEIQECDEEALKYLKDIKWCKVDDPKGFKIDFFFDPNPFFKNSVLTKTYDMIEDDEPILDKAIGTEIEWLKCLTLKSVKKKPKNGLKKARLITRTERCESFFNFFKPPQIPEEDTEMDEKVAEELQNQLEHDYDVGSTIRDKIIPCAVSWFTGEAVQDEEGEDFVVYMDEDDDVDEEEEEENEDEDDEEEEEEEEEDNKDEDDGEEEEEEDNEDEDDGEEDHEDGDNDEDEYVESKIQRKSSSGRKESGRAHSGEAQVDKAI